MRPSVYYNEIDPGAAAWLRELIKAGALPDGSVDTRSIALVAPEDLQGYQQCHFFAGIGGWAYALQLAGWPSDKHVWTGSCPCQPWSIAGKGLGEADPRDLWPVWFKLIEQCRPATLLGEQIAAKAGLRWLDRVYADVEGAGYTIGAADLCAAGARAPHLRQRLYFVADTARARRQQESCGAPSDETTHGRAGRNGGEPYRDHQLTGHGEGDHAGVADPHSGDSFWGSGPLQVGWNAITAEVERGGRRYRAQWRVKPGVSLLAHGVPNRVAKLCGLGNAIVPQVAEVFIRAYLDA